MNFHIFTCKIALTMKSKKFTYSDDFRMNPDEFRRQFVFEQGVDKETNKLYIYSKLVAVIVILLPFVPPLLMGIKWDVTLFCLAMQISLVSLIILLAVRVFVNIKANVNLLSIWIRQLYSNDNFENRYHWHHIDSKMDEVIHRLEKMESGKDDALKD